MPNISNSPVEAAAVEPVVAPWARPFLTAAGVSFVASVGSWFLVDREVGLFIGLWVPSILGLGALLGSARTVR